MSHAGIFALYFVLPLLLRLTVGTRDPFVRAHATEALNGQITFGIFWNVAGLGGMIGSAATHDSRWLLLFIGSGLASVWIVINSILGAVRAYHGVPYSYPGNIRFVRGSFARP